MNFREELTKIIKEAKVTCEIETSAKKFLTETLNALRRMQVNRVANIKELIFYVQDNNIYVKESEDNHLNIYIQKNVQDIQGVFNTIKHILKSEKAQIKSENEKKIVISIIFD